MKVSILLILTFSLGIIALKMRKYQKSQIVKSYDIIEERKEPKSEMQCCTLCSSTVACEGIKFEDLHCSLVRNTKIRAGTPSIDAVPVWINNEIHAKKSKLLVINGAFGNGEKTEIIDLEEPKSKNCLIVDFPLGLKSAFYGLIEPDIPMICGGVNPENTLQFKCIMLVNGQFVRSGPSHAFKLTTKREMWSDSVATINGSLVAVGGKGGKDNIALGPFRQKH